MIGLTLDHLVVACADLGAGTAWAEDALGATLAPGGRHAAMGTHNRLIGCGDSYLEVIAVDPGAPAPGRPRWFGLDGFRGAPRLANWVCAADDLDAALREAPPGTGTPLDLARGDLRWRMAIPADGRLPFDGAFPALIAWQGAAHPRDRLPDSGLRLTRLEIAHPDALALAEALQPLIADPRVVIVTGPAKAMRATFDGPHGPRVLAG